MIYSIKKWHSIADAQKVLEHIYFFYKKEKYLDAFMFLSELLLEIEEHLCSVGYSGSLIDDSFAMLVNGNKWILGEFYQLTGELAAILNKTEKALENYQKFQYWNGQTVPLYLKDKQTIVVYSFRPMSTYVLSDLANSQITCCRPSCMNDPFDSLFEIWASDENLKQICMETEHIRPYCDSFKSFRIRSFVANQTTYDVDDTILTDNITMWSHYADNHKGFCVKYKLSERFIKYASYPMLNFCAIKPVKYTDSVNLSNKTTIDNELAFSTKATCWSCENEVRLIDFDKGINEDYKSIDLDKDSYIDEIIFGYKSAQPFQQMIMNVVSRLPYGNKVKFSKMQKNLRENIYKLKIVDVTSQ